MFLTIQKSLVDSKICACFLVNLQNSQSVPACFLCVAYVFCDLRFLDDGPTSTIYLFHSLSFEYAISICQLRTISVKNASRIATACRLLPCPTCGRRRLCGRFQLRLRLCSRPMP